MPGTSRTDADVLVVGAGFGGLGAAFDLAGRGARVVLCEALTYPGGCAGTFRRGGFGFDAGATLGAGFGPGQLFRRWIDDAGLAVETEPLDPVIDFRAPSGRILLRRDRAAFLDGLCALPGAPVAGVRAFFDEQARVASTMWALLDDPALLPPLSATAVLTHLLRAPRYAGIARWAGRPLLAVMERHGVADWTPLRTLAESLCRITVQCGVAEAEAPVALATMDYTWRGAAHVRGGMGSLARGIADGFAARGGDLRYATRVLRLGRRDGRWTAETNRGTVSADVVIANLLPQGVARLLAASDGPAAAVAQASLAPLVRDVETGWGAAMLYAVMRSDPSAAHDGTSGTAHGSSGSASHLEFVDDETAPFTEGNHVFLSISADGEPGRAPPGLRTATASTHVPLAELRSLPEADRAARIAGVQERMRRTIARRAPEWDARLVSCETASPRTFERFTFRDGGWVGGVPRRAGLANYRGLAPREILPGLHLVGDSVFPGQSTLAAAIGGTRAAEAAVRSGRLGTARAR